MINKLFPLFNAIDACFANIIPLILRLCLLGLVAGVLAIAIYAKISPQASITDLKQRGRILRRKMKNAELEFKVFYSLSIENLKISLKLLFLVIGPALISTIPVLILAAWIHTYYGYEVSQTTVKDILIKPDSVGDVHVSVTKHDSTQSDKLTAINFDNISNVIILIDGKSVYSGGLIKPPTPVLCKRKWWNIILETPAGYLAEDAPIDCIYLNIQKKFIIGWMPEWAAGWELPFFMSLLIAALIIKFKFKIQ